MDEQKESHRIEMENLRKALREENDRTIQHIEGVLARWWQRRNWRKNSERKDILNGRNPKNRQEQKDHMCDGSDDDITNLSGSLP